MPKRVRLSRAKGSRGRPPLGAPRKISVTLRIDTDTLNAYRATGDGWQSRINADLHKTAKKLKTG